MRRLAAAAMLWLAAQSAHAQEEAQTPEEEVVVEPRPIPDYGRAPEVEDPAEAWLWIPRVIFYPVHLLFEYGVRVPLRELFKLIEVEHLDAIFVRGMASDEPGNWWFVPAVRFDHGFQPSAGLVLRLRDDTDVLQGSVGVDLWGTEQIRGRARGSVDLGPSTLALALMGGYRTDRIYHGMGWDAPPNVRARYAHARGRARLSLTTPFWQESSIVTGVRFEAARFEDSSFAQDAEISMAEAVNRVGAPPGFPDGFSALAPFVRLVIDSRDAHEWPHQTGVRGEAFGVWAVDVERGPEASWARAGGSLEVALELIEDRTLRLRGMVEIAEPLGEDEVPFTEQIVLGGRTDRMPGYLEGRLVDRSAAILGIAWRYEIWTWMDAELFVDAGNVFGERFRDFHFDRMRLSFGTALRTRDGDDFTFLFALGTEPFVLGADVSSVRFALSVGVPP